MEKRGRENIAGLHDRICYRLSGEQKKREK